MTTAPAPDTTPDAPEASGAEAGERRVTTLELFFDLVFVFTITQLTVLLTHQMSFAQAGRVTLIFAVLFWMYGAYAYLTNQVPPQTPARRLLVIVGMCGFMVCALAVPGVFGRDGVAFGLGFLVVTVVHGSLYALIHRRAVLSFALTNALAALCVTLAGTTSGTTTDLLWIAAVVLQNVTPLISNAVSGDYILGRNRVTSRVTERVGALDPAHFVERHGLLLIVAFGESVVAIGAGAGTTRLDLSMCAGIVLVIAVAAALWWTYFVRDEEEAQAALRRATGAARFRLTMQAYYYAFIPMLLGIAVLAAGVKTSIGRLPHHVPTATAVALAGGVALFLAGSTAFRATLHIRPLRHRACTAVLVMAAVPLGARVNVLAELGVLAALLVLMLLAEDRART